MLSPAVRIPFLSSQSARTIVAAVLCCGTALLAGCASEPATASNVEAPADSNVAKPPLASDDGAPRPSGATQQASGADAKRAPTRAANAPANTPANTPTNAPPGAGSGPASLKLVPFTPGFSVRELRASGTVEFVGPFPFRYRIDFCPPEEFAANCPAPIIGTATGPKQPFVAPFGGRPPTTQRYTIDVVATVLDGSAKGASLRSAQGLVVNPNGVESGKRGRCPGQADDAEDAVEAGSKR